MTSAAEKCNTVNSSLFSHSANTGIGTIKVADFSSYILKSYARLLRCAEEIPGGLTLTSYEKSGLRTEYDNFLRSAGTARTGTTLQIDNDVDEDNPIDAENKRYVPINSNQEILILLSGVVSTTGDFSEWLTAAPNKLMTTWDQAFDYAIDARETAPSASIYDNFYATSSSDNVTYNIKRSFGTGTQIKYLVKYSNNYAIPEMTRLADWAKTLARSLFFSEEGFRTNPESAEIMAVFPNGDGTVTYTLKEICLLLVAFAACHTRTILEPPGIRAYFVNSADEGLARATFRSTGAATLNELFSHVPVSFDCARLCLSVVSSQISTALPGLRRLTATSDSPADLLVGGKFSPIYTPCQTGAASIRRAEYLSRPRKSPFHSRKYDALSVSRVYENNAIRALYKCELMRHEDTRIIFVGLPAGLQHVLGSDQRFAKISITLRDQVDPAVRYEPITFIFDMYMFVSADVCAALNVAPWTVTGAGNLQEALSSATAFKVALTGTKSFGNLSRVTSRVIDIPNVVSPGLVGTSVDDKRVRVSDFIADVDFLDITAARSELALSSVIPTANSPRLIGNHLVDSLLKTHVRNMSGLDLSESTFTTSDIGFKAGDPSLLDEARSYIFNACMISAIRTTQSTDSSAFSTDLKMLDVLSATPLIRSSGYADLCFKPTYFDRVFALPINARMFRRV
jgi:hypothetical protein